MEPDYSTKVIKPDHSMKVIKPGHLMKKIKPDHSMKVIKPSHSWKAIKPNNSEKEIKALFKEGNKKMTYEEKTLSTERIYEGRILNLRKDKVSVIGESTSYREIVEHSGGATMAAVTADGKMLMVKQFRKPAGKVMLEAPAGKLEKGEDPLEAAKRELKEETGYTAENVKRLCSFYSSVGYSEEVLTLYLCTGLTPGETDFDENEAIDNVEIPLEELYEMAVNGEIDDAKTLIAIFMAKAALENEALRNEALRNEALKNKEK